MTTTLTRMITREISIPLSGEDIAELFWSLDECGQAEFFNRLGMKDFLAMQLHALMFAENLTDKGRQAMSRIGEYAYPQ